MKKVVLLFTLLLITTSALPSNKTPLAQSGKVLSASHAQKVALLALLTHGALLGSLVIAVLRDKSEVSLAQHKLKLCTALATLLSFLFCIRKLKERTLPPYIEATELLFKEIHRNLLLNNQYDPELLQELLERIEIIIRHEDANYEIIKLVVASRDELLANVKKAGALSISLDRSEQGSDSVAQ